MFVVFFFSTQVLPSRRKSMRWTMWLWTYQRILCARLWKATRPNLRMPFKSFLDKQLILLKFLMHVFPCSDIIAQAQRRQHHGQRSGSEGWARWRGSTQFNVWNPFGTINLNCKDLYNIYPYHLPCIYTFAVCSFAAGETNEARQGPGEGGCRWDPQAKPEGLGVIAHMFGASFETVKDIRSAATQIWVWLYIILPKSTDFFKFILSCKEDAF